MEDLAVWLAERVAKFPRAHKFTVGDRIVIQPIEVSALLSWAAFTRDKAALLRDASKALFRLQASARLAERLQRATEPSRWAWMIGAEARSARAGICAGLPI